MVKESFKQIDLLRKRRDFDFFLVEPNFIDKQKYIKKGIFSGLIIILITLILGIPFIFRTKFLENKKSKIKIFSDEYDSLVKKINKESKELKEISKFNSNLKNSILNISSSSALLQEIALIIPIDLQLLEFFSKGNSLVLKAKTSNDDYLGILNSFLINLDKSELIKFNDIDLISIKTNKNAKNSKNKSYVIKISTKLSNKYSDINEKYLIKLGSYGLFNRLNILKNLDNQFD